MPPDRPSFARKEGKGRRLDHCVKVPGAPLCPGCVPLDYGDPFSFPRRGRWSEEPRAYTQAQRLVNITLNNQFVHLLSFDMRRGCNSNVSLAPASFVRSGFELEGRSQVSVPSAAMRASLLGLSIFSHSQVWGICSEMLAGRGL